LKGCFIPNAAIKPEGETEEDIAERKKVIEEKKQKLEELIRLWKVGMGKSENIVKYIDHWYSEDNKFFYNVMEYCAGGDLVKKSKRELKKKENSLQKFQKQFYIIRIYDFKGGSKICGRNHISNIGAA
jgi:serine/threonine protein kinase